MFVTIPPVSYRTAVNNFFHYASISFNTIDIVRNLLTTKRGDNALTKFNLYALILSILIMYSNGCLILVEDTGKFKNESQFFLNDL